MNRRRPSPALLFLLLPLAGCVQVRTDPIEVKPIHITVDVNVRVERALDDFFGQLDSESTTLTAASTPAQP